MLPVIMGIFVVVIDGGLSEPDVVAVTGFPVAPVLSAILVVLARGVVGFVDPEGTVGRVLFIPGDKLEVELEGFGIVVPVPGTAGKAVVEEVMVAVVVMVVDVMVVGMVVAENTSGLNASNFGLLSFYI